MFTVKGRIVQILDVIKGTSSKGEWTKQEFIIETEGQYPKRISMTLFNDKFNVLGSFKAGDTANVSFSVESREYQGRWFTNVNAFKIEKVQEVAQQQNAVNAPAFEPLPPTEETNDNLPF